MDSIGENLALVLGRSETARWLVVALLGAGIYCGCLLVVFVLSRHFSPIRKQLDALAVREAQPVSALERLAESLDRFSELFLPSNLKLRSRTIDRLTHAGYRSPNRLVVYYFVRLALMVCLPALTLLSAPLFPKVSMQHFFGYAVSACLFGMIAPSYYLDRKKASQQRTLRNALPDAVDLLVVCTEAGLGLNAALLRVAQMLADIHPELADELSQVCSEIRAGIDRNQALTNLAQRTGLDDIKGLVAVLAQSMRFGTSVAQTLRVYSEEFRDKRMQKADEEAAKLATKMIFPLTFCFMPGFFIVALGPTIVSVTVMWAGGPTH